MDVPPSMQAPLALDPAGVGGERVDGGQMPQADGLEVLDRVDGDDGRPSDLATMAPECLICGAEAIEVDSCCSLSCVEDAQRELRANAKRLRRLPRHPDLLDARHELAERNGRLTSALMRWRPSVRRPHHRLG
jgi:hypothetical protein